MDKVVKIKVDLVDQAVVVDILTVVEPQHNHLNLIVWAQEH